MHRSTSTSSIATEESAVAWADRSERPTSPTYRRTTRCFRQALVAAVEAALRVEREPQGALHDFRRGVRDARAVLAACKSLLPTEGFLELQATLRAVTRATGAMRDRDALPEVLASLPVAMGTAEARAALESRLLVDRFASRQPRQRARRLAVAAAKVTPLADRFDELLPREFTPVQLRAGWQRLAKRARKAAKAAARTPDAVPTVHTARKRLRQLGAALRLLAKRDTRAARRASRLARLAAKLGETLDCARLAEVAQRSALHDPTVLADGAAVELAATLERRSGARRVKLLQATRRMLARRRWKSRA